MSLQDIDLFGHLNSVEQARLLGQLERVEAKAGQVIVREGDLGDNMYMIVTGPSTAVSEGSTPNSCCLS